jgi:hypothetical protein
MVKTHGLTHVALAVAERSVRSVSIGRSSA